MEEPKKSYYAIIPANVRYDKTLPPNAKLLYGEITALCNSEGYCWAANKYFAELYGVTVTSISKWINAPSERGYIHSEIIYKEGTKEIDKRYITIVNDPIKEKFKDNITYSNNTSNNTKNGSKGNSLDEITDALPQGEQDNTPVLTNSSASTAYSSASVTDSSMSAQSTAKHKQAKRRDIAPLFARFWEAYPKKCNKSKAEQAFYKINPDQTLVDKILSALSWQTKSPNWQKENGQYVPYATTYLNGKRWEDEPPRDYTAATEPARLPKYEYIITEDGERMMIEIEE